VLHSPLPDRCPPVCRCCRALPRLGLYPPNIKLHHLGRQTSAGATRLHARSAGRCLSHPDRTALNPCLVRRHGAGSVSERKGRADIPPHPRHVRPAPPWHAPDTIGTVSSYVKNRCVLMFSLRPTGQAHISTTNPTVSTHPKHRPHRLGRQFPHSAPVPDPGPHRPDCGCGLPMIFCRVCPALPLTGLPLCRWALRGPVSVRRSAGDTVSRSDLSSCPYKNTLAQRAGSAAQPAPCRQHPARPYLPSC